jgi:phosphatidylethanolamine-binding protein (PEBP) family uncharacterized protein
MSTLFRVFCVLLLAVMIEACASAPVSPNAVKLIVDFSWTNQNRCSSVSPEIKISAIPQATKELKVSLTDRDMPSYNHGGGTVKYQGSNIIPAGALKGYTGPCPPSGQHTYTIDVQAIDATGTIIGFGEKSSSCCQ